MWGFPGQVYLNWTMFPVEWYNSRTITQHCFLIVFPCLCYCCIFIYPLKSVYPGFLLLIMGSRFFFLKYTRDSFNSCPDTSRQDTDDSFNVWLCRKRCTNSRSSLSREKRERKNRNTNRTTRSRFLSSDYTLRYKVGDFPHQKEQLQEPCDFEP